MSMMSLPEITLKLTVKFILSCYLALSFCGLSSAEGVHVTDADNKTVLINSSKRIVALNGSNTEILFALGAGEQVVGCDLSSTYPPKAKKLPNIGYQYRLNAEGILALKPELVIGRRDAKPAQVITQLRAAGVATLLLKEPRNFDEAKVRINKIGHAIGKDKQADKLIQKLEQDLLVLESKIKHLSLKAKKTALFLYLRGPQTAMVLGNKTGPGAMLELSGAINCSGDIKDTRPMTAEAVVAARPDVLILFESGLKSIGGVEGLLKLPGIAQTPAGRNQRIISIDGLFLSGFGVRSGKAALALFQAIYEKTGFTPVEFIAESSD